MTCLGLPQFAPPSPVSYGVLNKGQIMFGLHDS